MTIQDQLNEPGDLFRVWPDGTVQMCEDGVPYPWMSDDYTLVLAANEEDAVRRVLGE